MFDVCCCRRHVGLIVLVVQYQKRVVKVVCFCFVLRNIYIYFYKVNPNKLKLLSLASPVLFQQEHVGGHETSRSNDCIFVFSTLACIVFVSFYSHYRPFKLCPTKKLHILILFFSSYLRLKFCKTPFHVVLSKNKTNTKKKNIISHY